MNNESQYIILSYLYQIIYINKVLSVKKKIQYIYVVCNSKTAILLYRKLYKFSTKKIFSKKIYIIYQF